MLCIVTELIREVYTPGITGCIIDILGITGCVTRIYEYKTYLCLNPFPSPDRMFSLPLANEVWRKVMLSQVFVCPQGGLCMMSLHVWLPGPMLLMGGLSPWSHVPSKGGLCPEGGLCVEGGLCPGGSLSRGSLSRRVSVWGSLFRVSLSRRGLCPGGLCLGWVSVSGSLCPGGSLSRGPGFLSGGSLFRVSLSRRVSVWGASVQGVSVQRGISVGRPPGTRKADSTHPTGMLSCFS